MFGLISGRKQRNFFDALFLNTNSKWICSLESFKILCSNWHEGNNIESTLHSCNFFIIILVYWIKIRFFKWGDIGEEKQRIVSLRAFICQREWNASRYFPRYHLMYKILIVTFEILLKHRIIGEIIHELYGFPVL